MFECELCEARERAQTQEKERERESKHFAWMFDSDLDISVASISILFECLLRHSHSPNNILSLSDWNCAQLHIFSLFLAHTQTHKHTKKNSGVYAPLEFIDDENERERRTKS